jgi:electron transfer flavoprotein alpha subunit
MSVIVYVEHWDNKFKKLSFELISYSVKMAEMLGTEAVALSIGNVPKQELQKLGKYGVKRILSVDDESTIKFDSQVYSRIISEVATSESAKVIVLANNNTGKSLAPRLSVRLQAAIASGVNQLPDSVTPFVVKKRAFSGSAFARIHLTSEIKVITLSQNSFDLVENPVETVIESANVSVDQLTSKIQIKETQKQTGKLLLQDAEIVISGGRGMKSSDNWAPLIELAELLNGATACSRPVSDEGWRPHEEHTGQTGKIISPNLYVAVGISGATQHLAGISSSKYIVAINTDKDAPIFDAAQYGIVGDAVKVLPRLVEAVKVMKSS